MARQCQARGGSCLGACSLSLWRAISRAAQSWAADRLEISELQAFLLWDRLGRKNVGSKLVSELTALLNVDLCDLSEPLSCDIEAKFSKFYTELGNVQMANESYREGLLYKLPLCAAYFLAAMASSAEPARIFCVPLAHDGASDLRIVAAFLVPNFSGLFECWGAAKGGTSAGSGVLAKPRLAGLARAV